MNKNISNIAIIELRLWADGILIPQQTPSLFRCTLYIHHFTKPAVTFTVQFLEIHNYCKFIILVLRNENNNNPS